MHRCVVQGWGETAAVFLGVAVGGGVSSESLTMHGIKLDEVSCALSYCQIIKMHDLKLVWARKCHPEGQTANPATPATSKDSSGCEKEPLRPACDPTLAGVLDGDESNRGYSMVRPLCQGKKGRTGVVYCHCCYYSCHLMSAWCPPVDRHTHGRHAVQYLQLLQVQ